MALDIIAAVITYAAVGVGAWFIGGYMVKVYKGERVWLSPVIGPVERATYKIIGVDRRARAGLDLLPRLTARGHCREHRVHLRGAPVPELSASQPREPPRCSRAARVQHGDELRHEHELAELLRRDHDELLLADRGTRHSSVPQRRGGHGGGDRGHPCDRPPNHEHAGQFLGGHGARHPLHPAADQRGARARAGCHRSRSRTSATTRSSTR